jgi:hypothetical protein
MLDRVGGDAVAAAGGDRQWGKGRKPITQNALARLLKPHNVSPTDVGPEHARRKGYRRAQFERSLIQGIGPRPLRGALKFVTFVTR